MFGSGFSISLILLLICHFIGDYYFQTNKTARLKENNFRKTVEHSVIYSLPFLFLLVILLFLIPMNFYTISIIAGVIISHAAIDFLKCFMEYFVYKKENSQQNNPPNNSQNNLQNNLQNNSQNNLQNPQNNPQKTNEIKRVLYFVDQGLHLFFVFIFAFFLSSSVDFYFISADFHIFLKWILFAVAVSKPVNVSFKKFFEKYQPIENDDPVQQTSVSGAGSIIGTLERYLMGIFIGANQFAALGLVIAAKSIARYDQISQNKLSAEYFLIGTLYSVLATLIIYFALFIGLD